MLIWLVFAVLTAAVIYFVVRPLLRNHEQTPRSSALADLAVYRDQLSEIDADVDRGAIGTVEAEAARAEVSRKILQLTENTGGNPAAGEMHSDGKYAAPATVSNKLPLVLAAGVPLSAAFIYLALGAPHLPDQPYAPRFQQDINTATAANLLARVEAALRKNPEDGQGWDVIAPFYFRAGRYVDAADAYRKAIQLLGESVPRLIGYVKASILANNGIVTEELRVISDRLLTKAPDRAEPRFWLALAKEQDGDVSGARKAYQDLLATATGDEPWRETVEKRLNGLGASPQQ